MREVAQCVGLFSIHQGLRSQSHQLFAVLTWDTSDFTFLCVVILFASCSCEEQVKSQRQSSNSICFLSVQPVILQELRKQKGSLQTVPDEEGSFSKVANEEGTCRSEKQWSQHTARVRAVAQRVKLPLGMPTCLIVVSTSSPSCFPLLMQLPADALGGQQVMVPLTWVLDGVPCSWLQPGCQEATRK